MSSWKSMVLIGAAALMVAAPCASAQTTTETPVSEDASTVVGTWPINPDGAEQCKATAAEYLNQEKMIICAHGPDQVEAGLLNIHVTEPTAK